MPFDGESLAGAARGVLLTPGAADKVAATRAAFEAWRNGHLPPGTAVPPERPARPATPEVRPPRHMPKRRPGGIKGRIALLHALAHIELNAIDLAWDAVVRFAALPDAPERALDDWARVALDEAEHFDLLEQRLNALGAAYGDLPAHDGLWESAEDTADDLAARMAVVPMTHEARALDTAPATVERLRHAGDTASADVLERIAREEVDHVAAGVRWFRWLCERRGAEPVAAYHAFVRARFGGGLKAPFNDADRAAAGLTPDFYEPLAG